VTDDGAADVDLRGRGAGLERGRDEVAEAFLANVTRDYLRVRDEAYEDARSGEDADRDDG